MAPGLRDEPGDTDWDHDVPKKVKAGRPRVDRGEQAAEIDEEIDQQIDDVKANRFDDIPWDYSVE